MFVKKLIEEKIKAKDLKEFLLESLDDIVESHLEAYQERYYGYVIEGLGLENRIWTDVYVNHDYSADIEYVEEQDIKREMTDEEKAAFEIIFAEEIIARFK